MGLLTSEPAWHATWQDEILPQLRGVAKVNSAKSQPDCRVDIRKRIVNEDAAGVFDAGAGQAYPENGRIWLSHAIS